MGYLKSTVANYLPYALPTQVTDVFTQGRALASAMLPVAGIKHACAITTIQKSLRYNKKAYLIFLVTLSSSFSDFWLHHKMVTCILIPFLWMVETVNSSRNMVSSLKMSLKGFVKNVIFCRFEEHRSAVNSKPTAATTTASNPCSTTRIVAN